MNPLLTLALLVGLVAPAASPTAGAVPSPSATPTTEVAIVCDSLPSAIVGSETDWILAYSDARDYEACSDELQFGSAFDAERTYEAEAKAALSFKQASRLYDAKVGPAMRYDQRLFLTNLVLSAFVHAEQAAALVETAGVPDKYDITGLLKSLNIALAPPKKA